LLIFKNRGSTKHENLKITLHRKTIATMTRLTIQTPLSSTKIQISNRMGGKNLRLLSLVINALEIEENF